MIAVDTSALIAILWNEIDAKELRAKLAAAGGGAIGAPTGLELQHVLMRTGSSSGWDDVEALFAKYNISIRSFDAMQLSIARDAATRFGKGRHKAALNFGDCFSYALAKAEGAKLLCKGGDFQHTDIELA